MAISDLYRVCWTVSAYEYQQKIKIGNAGREGNARTLPPPHEIGKAAYKPARHLVKAGNTNTMITAADHDKISPHIEIITVVVLTAKRTRTTFRPIINEKGFARFGLEVNALHNKQHRPTRKTGVINTF